MSYFTLKLQLRDFFERVEREKYLVRNCGQQRWSGKRRVEPSAAELPPSLSSSFQSWCKQPCWCELVPVSG